MALRLREDQVRNHRVFCPQPYSLYLIALVRFRKSLSVDLNVENESNSHQQLKKAGCRRWPEIASFHSRDLKTTRPCQSGLYFHFFSAAASSISGHTAAKINATPIPIDTSANR